VKNAYEHRQSSAGLFLPFAFLLLPSCLRRLDVQRRNFLGFVAWFASLGRNGFEQFEGAFDAATTQAAESQRGKSWAAFEMAALKAKRAGTQRPFLEFLRAPTLFAGLYALAAGVEDRQPAHKEDELYYVVSGRAVLRIGEEEQAVQPGSVVYVKAGMAHRFHSIKEDLQVLVFFSTAAPGEGLKLNI
jgi:mannose-6-phosphate isomerase-like protein (cupin superfamily)